MIRFSHGAATSVGRVRHVNEDSYLAVPPLFVVADGMGGTALATWRAGSRSRR